MNVHTRNIYIALFTITSACFLPLWIVDEVGAQKNMRVYVNDHEIVYEKQLVQDQGRALVPLRETFRALNATVSWDASTQTVRATDGKNIILIPVGHPVAIINHKPFKLDIPAKFVNQSIYIPLRFVSETLHTAVHWQSNDAIVYTATRTSTPITINAQRKTIQQIATLGRSIFLIESYNANNELIGTGSGFLLTDEGTIATNFHVIRDAKIIRVVDSEQNRYVVNQLLYTNEMRDLALIKVSETINLPKLVLGDSDQLTIGDDIVTIGSPKGLQNTVSNGIISGVRLFEGQQLIQITAPITFGSSGGALFDMYGNVIGITSSGIDAQGNLNFAIPINDVKKVMVSLSVS